MNDSSITGKYREYLDALGLKDFPNFEELDPANKIDFRSYVGRDDASIPATIAQIEAASSLAPMQVLLMSASPGVGKSTFVRFLAHAIPESIYISLFDYSPAFEYNYSVSLTNHHIVRFAAKLERELHIQVRKEKNIDPQKLGKHAQYESIEEFEIDDYVIDALEPTFRKEIDKRIYIFVDNIDFLGVTEQFRILRIIGSIQQNNKNIGFIVSGRPFITMMARTKPREFIGTSTQLIHHLSYLNVGKVLQSRLDAVSKSDSDRLNSFISSKAITFLEYFIDGNIALGLKILADLFIKRPYMRNANSIQCSLEDLQHVMLGEQLLPVKPDDRRQGNFGFIVDIVGRVKAADRIPVVYYVLKKLREETLVETERLQNWSQEIHELDNQGRIYSDRDLRELLDLLRGMRLVRRTGVSERTKMLAELAGGSVLSPHMDCYYKITRTGVATIELSKTRRYRDMVNITSYPTGYRDYILKDTAKFEYPIESEPWEAD